MFQSKIIARFHHLYLMQAILELQRHCSKLYVKLKHRIVFLLLKNRIALVGLRSRLLGQKDYRQNDCLFGFDCNDGRHFCDNGSDTDARGIACPFEFDDLQQGNHTNVMNDLNRLLLIGQHRPDSKRISGAISIPMLLLPLALQPQPCAKTVEPIDCSQEPTNRHAHCGHGKPQPGSVGIDCCRRGQQQLHLSSNIVSEYPKRSDGRLATKSCSISEILSKQRMSSLTCRQKSLLAGNREVSSGWSMDCADQHEPNWCNRLAVRNPLLSGFTKRRTV